MRELRPLEFVLCSLLACVVVAPMSVQAQAADSSGIAADEAGPDAGDHLLDPVSFVDLWVVDQDGWDGLRVPLSGELKIDFNRQYLKTHLTPSSAASISISGVVRGSNNESRAIEIDGYSVIGDTKEWSLNIQSARTGLDLLQSGGRYAHRTLHNADLARLESLRAQQSVVENHLTTLESALDETVKIMSGVYARARNWTLWTEQVAEAAEGLRIAEASLGGFPGDLQVAVDSEGPAFFRRQANASLDRWMQQLQDPENAVVLELLGGLIGRSSDVITANVTSNQALLSQIRGLSAAEQATQIEPTVALAREMIRIEQGVFLGYMRLDTSVADFTGKPLLLTKVDPGFRLNALIYPPVFIAGLVEEQLDRAPSFETLAADSGTPRQLATRKFNEFVRLVRQQAGRGPNATNEGLFLINELEVWYEQRQRLIERNNALREAIAKLDAKIKTIERVTTDPDNVAITATNVDVVEALLMSEIIDGLVERVPPTYVNLSSLGLTEGDRLVLRVGALPALNANTGAPGQKTYEMEAVRQGWNGRTPQVGEIQMFARARNDAETNFSLRSGVQAMWTYYGDNDTWRTFSPSLGMAATFLSFGSSTDTLEDADTLQFGFGPVVGLFDRAVLFTFGYNLQAEAKKGANASRKYIGLGLSVTQVVSNVRRLVEGGG